MKCPTCGAENDAANRFCEQCGSRIEPSGGYPQAQVALASQPTAAGPTCPSCGAAVLPGEAFCDECGASLSAAVPTVIPGNSYDAPTMFAPPMPAASPDAGTPSAGEQMVTCPACGQPNLPTDRFCDHCGASLTTPPPAVATTEAPTVIPEQAQQSANNAPASDATIVAPPAGPAAAPAPPEPPADVALAEAPTAEQPMVTSAAAGAQEAYEAERKRLEEEIARQQTVIAQLEPVQTALGAATPAGVAQSLQQAREAKAKAEADLTALTGGTAPAPAAPSEAQAQEAAAEAALGQIGAVPAPAAVIPPAPAAPASPASVETAISEPVREPEVAPQPMPAPAPQPAPAPAAAPAPRLVMDEGKDLPLPTDKHEIIIGREDPISGIFPEIDLTPYGGETGGVSRQHARLTHSDGQWTVTDLNSTNYTRVDGAKIEPNVPTPIKDGSRLQFGRVAMTFRT
jgi:predicted amidophosphoribosyltransferase